MPRHAQPRTDNTILEMAIIGYQNQMENITAKLAEVKAQLGQSDSSQPKATATETDHAVPDEKKEAGAPETLSIDDQLEMAKKLAILYRTSIRDDGREAPILPVPVRLFIEEAKRLSRAGRPLDGLLLSVPEVDSRYLEQVNPQEPSVPNFLRHSEMLRAALILAKLALADNFIPKEFYPDEAGAKLKEGGWTDPQKLAVPAINRGIEVLRRVEEAYDFPVYVAEGIQRRPHLLGELHSC